MPGVMVAGSISIIIPVFNGSSTIKRCLEAALNCRYPAFEVIVVDDGSDDDTSELTRQFPCKLIRLPKRCGASRARNVGAALAKGDILFFTDADCLLQEDTLTRVGMAMRAVGCGVVLGGTYSRIPADNGFFSRFQSIFIHDAETKRHKAPDYVATHAMAVDAGVFREQGGFAEEFLPIIEDVEFSHRMRRRGYRLAIDAGIQVRHIFNFSLAKSLHNALTKATFWTMYSMSNKDLFADSGAASWGLKVNVISYCLIALLAVVFVITLKAALLAVIALLTGMNLLMNRRLIQAFYGAGGSTFSIGAILYYLLLYPIPVGAGAFMGMVRYLGARPALEVRS